MGLLLILFARIIHRLTARYELPTADQVYAHLVMLDDWPPAGEPR